MFGDVDLTHHWRPLLVAGLPVVDQRTRYSNIGNGRLVVKRVYASTFKVPAALFSSQWGHFFWCRLYSLPLDPAPWGQAEMVCRRDSPARWW